MGGDMLRAVMSIETREDDSLAFGGYLISAAFCAVLGLLGAWGSPSWFSAFPLRYAYRVMDALGAYALSCATTDKSARTATGALGRSKSSRA
jgi:hypothetical protein